MRAVALVFFASACLPTLQVPSSARIECGSDDECPADLVCARGAARCVAADSTCVVNGIARPDGETCNDDGAICVRAACVESRCGDGFVDLLRDETCDVALPGPCRSNCQVPFCGDGIIDPGEECDSELIVSPTCFACYEVCSIATPSFDNCAAQDEPCGCQKELRLTGLSNREIWGAGRAAGVGYAVVSNRDATFDVVSWRDDGGDVETLSSGAAFAAFAQGEDAVFIAETTASIDFTITRYDGAGPEVLYAQGGLVTALAVDGDVLYAATGASLYRGTTSGGFPSPISDFCVGAFTLLRCGETLVCAAPEEEADDRFRLEVIPLGGGDRRVVTTSFGLHPGCTPDARLVWSTTFGVFEERDGAPFVITELPRIFAVPFPLPTPLRVTETHILVPVLNAKIPQHPIFHTGQVDRSSGEWSLRWNGAVVGADADNHVFLRAGSAADDTELVEVLPP